MPPSTSTPFTHTPLPAAASEPYPEQRYFLGTTGSRWVGPQADGAARIMRMASRDEAYLVIRATRDRCDVSAELTLTPAELRELAQRLLDAAHDIETAPAALLTHEPGDGA